MLVGADGIPFGVMYTGGKPTVRYWDPASEWARLHAGLMKAFPGQLVGISDVSADGRKLLFVTGSDRQPGAYYVFNRDTGKVDLIGQRTPWLPAERLAPSTPIEFKARDGVKLFGFYTATGASARPLILMPHGGPFGPMDSWGYDSDAQFLASRGYGVLQVNYRGSGGRGETFQKSGWTHWGDLLIDDMLDGVKWAREQGLAREGEACTYGASYGGYAALMAPIRQPGAFKCAIGYAGVYDLPLLRKTDSSAETRAGRRWLDRAVGADPAALARQSPALRAAEIGIPVFLVHGKDDERARFDQYKSMLAALEATGKAPETFVLRGEGHGFYSPEAQAELYERLDAFLARHLPAR